MQAGPTSFKLFASLNARLRARPWRIPPRRSALVRHVVLHDMFVSAKRGVRWHQVFVGLLLDSEV